MSARKRRILQAWMNGRQVGRLSASPRGVLSFSYDRSWREYELGRAVSLSMPLSDREYSGPLVENYFDNLLPDTQPIRNRLQARVKAESIRCFDLLSHIGRDCVGALQLLPEGEVPDVQRISATALSEAEVADILEGHQARPLGIDLEADFRLSVAGAQEKTGLLLYEGRWHRPSGATPTSHLVKLPIGRIEQSGIDLSDSVENEWLCHLILKSFGITVANMQIKRFGNWQVLVVERFDRRWASGNSWLIRLPQEDMCQALGISGNLKYEADGGPGIETIMNVLLGSVDSFVDRGRFLKVQLLFWMLAAIDGHAKNFSIFHLRGGGFELTPLYDVISAYPLIQSRQLERQRVRMAMAVRSKNRHYHWNDITRRHWLETARICRFPAEEMDRIISECCDSLETVIEEVTNKLPEDFPGRISETIYTGMMKAKTRLARKTGLK